MNPTTPDDADLDRILTEHLDAEVHDVTAGPALLDRIRAEACTTAVSRHPGRLSTRWLWPIAAAAAVVLAVVFVTVGGEDDTDLATGENPDAPETQVLLSGEAGGEEWSVVEYVEDDPSIVDEPATCLRFEPPIEDGPFFCGTEDDIVGAHGKLVWRRSDRSGEQIDFNGHAVFAGVFGPQVAEVTLKVEGQEIVMEPTPWPGHGVGVAVAMLRVPEGVGFDVDLRDADDLILSRGSSSGTDPAPDQPPAVVAEPAAAAPGQTIELRFPTEVTRDVAWHMHSYDVRTARLSEPLHLLLSNRTDATAAPTWLPRDEEWTWDSVAVTGPGPDTIIIPDTAEEGMYVICPADDVDQTNCVVVTVAPAAWTLVTVLPEASRRVVVVDVDGLKASVGLPSDHAFLPPAGATDRMLLDELGSALPHLRRPTDRGAAAAIDAELVVRAAGNECSVGPECLAVVQTRQDHEDLRRRLLDEGWSADAGLLVNPGRVADVSYPVIGISPDLVFLGQDQATVRDAIEGGTEPPERLLSALDQVDGPARTAVVCAGSTAAIASTPGVSHQVASRTDPTVEAGDTITLAGDEYLVADVTPTDIWSVVTVEPTGGSARSLTHLADANEASVLPAVLAATFSC